MSHKVLSLDPGITSIGWAVTEHRENGCLSKFIDAGTRIFNATTEPKTGAFKNIKRRESRLARRNRCRDNRRIKKLQNFLI